MSHASKLRYPLVGWAAGMAAVLGLSLLWPSIFPGILQAQHYNSADLSFAYILGLALVVATPAALLGGWVGSRLPREGGRSEQTLVAALIGVILAVPFSCAGLWLLSSY